MKAVLLYYLTTLLFRTLRIQINAPSFIWSESIGRANLICFWHGDMLIGWEIARKKLPNIYAVVSPSKDGQILSGMLKKKGFGILSGSSDKDSKKLLQEIIGKLKSGTNIAITPDGPKGPNREAKAGSVVSAVRARSSLLALKVSYSHSKRLASWDNFVIPLPFSKVTVVVSQIHLDKVTDDNREMISDKIRELEESLG